MLTKSSSLPGITDYYKLPLKPNILTHWSLGLDLDNPLPLLGPGVQTIFQWFRPVNCLCKPPAIPMVAV